MYILLKNSSRKFKFTEEKYSNNHRMSFLVRNTTIYNNNKL